MVFANDKIITSKSLVLLLLILSDNGTYEQELLGKETNQEYKTVNNKIGNCSAVFKYLLKISYKNIFEVDE